MPVWVLRYDNLETMGVYSDQAFLERAIRAKIKNLYDGQKNDEPFNCNNIVFTSEPDTISGFYRYEDNSINFLLVADAFEMDVLETVTMYDDEM